MNKKQVADELGVSSRSVENYVKRGKLSVRYEKGATSDVAVFDPSEVRGLKAELQSRNALVPTVVREKPEGEARKPESAALTVRPSAPSHPTLPPSELAHMGLLNMADVCLLLRVSPHTVGQLIREGKLKAVRLGRGYKFRPDDLRRFIDSL